MIVWDKTCHDKHSCDFSDGELAWCSIGGGLRIFRFLWKGMMQGSEANGSLFVGDLKKKENRIHPTQKPVKLYKWLLTNYAKPGNKILDTHMGSQSSRIAAFNMGFDYWGWELDPEYFEAGCKRFKEQTAQTQLW
jgi:site-specific DNA-methyltransferase (adenine-specific)